jgi:hypothetical protein
MPVRPDESNESILFGWQHVSEECKQKLPKCSCKVNAGDPEVISYSVQIDCANKSLHRLPNTLPKNTAELDVSNNHVTVIIQFNQ